MQNDEKHEYYHLIWSKLSKKEENVPCFLSHNISFWKSERQVKALHVSVQVFFWDKIE